MQSTDCVRLFFLMATLFDPVAFFDGKVHTVQSKKAQQMLFKHQTEIHTHAARPRRICSVQLKQR